MKRAVFVGVQNSHVLAAEGYHQSYIRTGAELTVGKRTGEMYCVAAEDDGVVESVSPKGVIVKYASGKRKGYRVGRMFGRAEGTVYPHDVVANVKEGQKFRRGQNLTYNTGFFEPDWLDPSEVVYKTSKIVSVALAEVPETYEDSKAISQEFSETSAALFTKTKSIRIKFTQSVHNVIPVGSEVEPNQPLMLIEDEITSATGVYDAESLATLYELGKDVPKSSYRGRIDRIEVRYHGDKQDMTPTLKNLADKSDRVLKDELVSIASPVYTGQVNEDYRVEGKNLPLDHAEILVYITVRTGMLDADKGIFCNQLKCTTGLVYRGPIIAEDGTKIHAKFSYRSINARIVNSPVLMGTTNVLLRLGSKAMFNIYKGNPA